MYRCCHRVAKVLPLTLRQRDKTQHRESVAVDHFFPTATLFGTFCITSPVLQYAIYGVVYSANHFEKIIEYSFRSNSFVVSKPLLKGNQRLYLIKHHCLAASVIFSNHRKAFISRELLWTIFSS